VIGRISLRTATNGRHADAIGVAEMNFGGGDGLAVLCFHQRMAVAAPDLPKRSMLRKQSAQPVAIRRHRLRTESMQRHQDMIASGAKSADPVLRGTLAGVAHQAGA